jgi:hypothetical protein
VDDVERESERHHHHDDHGDILPERGASHISNPLLLVVEVVCVYVTR